MKSLHFLLIWTGTLWALCVDVPSPTDDPPVELQAVGTVSASRIQELSGLAKSRRHAGVFWTICDSGNPPHLYAIDRTGKLLAEYRVRGATNLDWEALAADDDGNLYIGDVGNNKADISRARLTRRVYCLREPDPHAAAPPNARAKIPELPVQRILDFTFPASPFDTEAMFVRHGKIYLISKHKESQCRVYSTAISGTGKASALVEVCTLDGIPRVTDATLSPDGRRLAVCSYSYAATFDLGPDPALERLGRTAPRVVHFTTKARIEGCSWDADQLVLAAEDGKLFALQFAKSADDSAPRGR